MSELVSGQSLRTLMFGVYHQVTFYYLCSLWCLLVGNGTRGAVHYLYVGFIGPLLYQQILMLC